MRYRDASAKPGEKHAYAVLTVNSVGLKSEPTPESARDVRATPPARDYQFDGTISRPVLENYLSRSISMEGLLNGRGDLDDNVRMLKSTGAKFIGRSLCLWTGEANLLRNLERAKQQIPKVRAADPDMILQACVFESVSTQVEQVPVPGSCLGGVVRGREGQCGSGAPTGPASRWSPGRAGVASSRPAAHSDRPLDIGANGRLF